jgi:beta-glucosidase
MTRRTLFLIAVALQVALSLTLLVGAALFLRTFQNLASADTGFNRDAVVTARFDPRLAQIQSAALPALFDRLLARGREIPGSDHAALAMAGAVTGSARVSSVVIDTEPSRPGDEADVREDYVTDEYFVVMGMPIVMGRALAASDALVAAWLPGTEGQGVADVLFGDTSPAGRLPVTFYESVADLPGFSDYAMEGRTYRYFRGKPVYAFGHGLSYTRFAYSGLKLSRPRVGASDTLDVSVDVKNTGARAGDEVVQLYVRSTAADDKSPNRSLRGFERVALKAGELRTVRFKLVPERDLARYDEARKALAVAPGEFEVEIGASSADVRERGRFTVAN